MAQILTTKWHSHAPAASTAAPHTEAEPLFVVSDIQLGRDGLQNLGHGGRVLHGDLARSHLGRKTCSKVRRENQKNHEPYYFLSLV